MYCCRIVFDHIDITTSIGVGSLGDGIDVYGAQLEEGSYSTSYIPTSGTTVTRLADTSSTTGLSSVMNDSEGVLYAEISALSNDGTTKSVSISDGSITNQIVIRYSSTANQISAYVTDSGTITASFTYVLSDALSYNKIALKYKVNDVSLWVNGVEVGTDTSATMPSGFDELNFSRGDGNNNFYGNVLMVFPSALTDEQLTDLTGTVQTSFNSLAISLGYTIL